MDDQPPALSEVQKIAGGVEIEVTYQDGHTERVKIHQLSPIKDFQRYLEVQNNEIEEVELYCRRQSGWAESLTPESFDAIADKGQELNLPLFRNWYRRLKARSEAMNPGFFTRAIKSASEQTPAGST
jgi:hypothetical protein